MADWNGTSWTSIERINNGKKYKQGDAIRISDINILFNNLFFLKGGK